MPDHIPKGSALNRFYDDNKTLLDRLFVLIITAILSYFGFDKLGNIEQKQDKAVGVAEVAVKEAQGVKADVLETKAFAAENLAKTTYSPEDVKAASDAKVEAQQLNVSQYQAK